MSNETAKKTMSMEEFLAQSKVAPPKKDPKTTRSRWTTEEYRTYRDDKVRKWFWENQEALSELSEIIYEGVEQMFALEGYEKRKKDGKMTDITAHVVETKLGFMDGPDGQSMLMPLTVSPGLMYQKQTLPQVVVNPDAKGKARYQTRKHSK